MLILNDKAMKNTKFIIRCVVLALAALAVFAAVSKVSGVGRKIAGLFHHELKIADTETVVAEINRISEFTTVCFYEEIPVVRTKQESIKSLLGLPDFTERFLGEPVWTGQIAYIVKGKVRAGYDLSKISEGDLAFRNDTLFVCLPELEIFDVIVNPGDVEEFDRQGTWTDDEVKSILASAKKEIRQDALDAGLAGNAIKSSQDKVRSFLQAFGFSNVVVVD